MAQDKNLDGLSLDDLEYTYLIDNPSSILVVDDEDVIRMVFDALLANTSYQVGYADSAEQALHKLEQEEYSLFIVDKNLPGRSGLELVRSVRDKKPEAGFIIITGYASYESAVEALRLGAYDYLEKPFSDLMLVREKIDGALDRQRLLHENMVLANQLRSVHKELRSKTAALELTRGNDPQLSRRVEQLRERVGRAHQTLHQAFRRFQALQENRLVPEQPAAEIAQLLDHSWSELSAAVALGEQGTSH